MQNLLDLFSRNSKLAIGTSMSVILLIQSVFIYIKIQRNTRRKRVMILNMIVLFCFIFLWFVESKLIEALGSSCLVVAFWLTMGGDNWFDDWKNNRKKRKKKLVGNHQYIIFMRTL